MASISPIIVNITAIASGINLTKNIVNNPKINTIIKINTKI